MECLRIISMATREAALRTSTFPILVSRHRGLLQAIRISLLRWELILYLQGEGTMTSVDLTFVCVDTLGIMLLSGSPPFSNTLACETVDAIAAIIVSVFPMPISSARIPPRISFPLLEVSFVILWRYLHLCKTFNR